MPRKGRRVRVSTGIYRDPSGRYAPSLALYRHSFATEKREGAS